MYDKGCMTSHERLYAAAALTEPDRVPLLVNNRWFAIRDIGYTLEDCYADAGKFVESQMRMATDFAHDALWCMGDMPLERVLGQKMVMPKNDVPHPLEPLLKQTEDLANLPRNPVLKGNGLTDYLLDITNRLRKSAGGAVPVVGHISSPFRQACGLRGTENLYMDMYENPTFVKQLVDYLIAPTCQFNELQTEAGADIIFFSCSVASRSCISRQLYEEFVHPSHMQVFAHLRSLGCKILYHLCGDWSDRFDLVMDEGPDIIHVDKIDLAWLKKEYGGKVCINGNVGSATTLLHGTAEQVRQEATDCIAKTAARGGFLLGADCAVPRDTPAANMHAMTQAVMEAAACRPKNPGG